MSALHAPRRFARQGSNRKESEGQGSELKGRQVRGGANASRVNTPNQHCGVDANDVTEVRGWLADMAARLEQIVDGNFDDLVRATLLLLDEARVCRITAETRDTTSVDGDTRARMVSLM